jgi:hypothetical protein
MSLRRVISDIYHNYLKFRNAFPYIGNTYVALVMCFGRSIYKHFSALFQGHVEH